MYKFPKGIKLKIKVKPRQYDSRVKTIPVRSSIIWARQQRQRRCAIVIKQPDSGRLQIFNIRLYSSSLEFLNLQVVVLFVMFQNPTLGAG